MTAGSIFVLSISNLLKLKAFFMQDDRMTGFLDKGKEKKSEKSVFYWDLLAPAHMAFSSTCLINCRMCVGGSHPNSSNQWPCQPQAIYLKCIKIVGLRDVIYILPEVWWQKNNTSLFIKFKDDIKPRKWLLSKKSTMDFWWLW